MSIIAAVTDLVDQLGLMIKCRTLSPTRSATHASILAGLSDGTVGSLGGFWYEVDSTVTGADSATDDLGVDGLKPHGEVYGQHFGVSVDNTSSVNQTKMQAALDAGYGPVTLTPGTYAVAGRLEIPVGGGILGVSPSNRPVLAFDNGTDVGIISIRNKDLTFRNLVIDTSAVTNTHAAVYMLGVWSYAAHSVELVGPGAVDPALGTVYYGWVTRSMYNTLTPGGGSYVASYTPWPAAVALDALEPADSVSTFGAYYAHVTTCRISGYSYGRFTVTREDGTSSRANQDGWSFCNIISNWYNTWMQGCGGGHLDLNVSEEGALGDSVVIEDQASGTGPIKIGGELSAAGSYFKGPGVLVNVAGLTSGDANSAGEEPMHLRATGGSSQIFGQRLGAFASTAGDFEGTLVNVPASSTITVATRAELGTNTTYECHLTGTGSTRADSANVAAAGSTGTVTLESHNPGTSALVAEINAALSGVAGAGTVSDVGLDTSHSHQVIWTTDGSDLQIENTTGGDISINYRAVRVV